MKTNLYLPDNINMRKAFAAIESGRKVVQAKLKAHHSMSKHELADLFREAIRPITLTVRDPKLTAKSGRIEITIYSEDEIFDMRSFWPKADHLRNIVLDVVGLQHSALSIRYVHTRRMTRIDVDFSWREVLWSESAEGLLF